VSGSNVALLVSIAFTAVICGLAVVFVRRRSAQGTARSGTLLAVGVAVVVVVIGLAVIPRL
jgi:hypothetical protein